MESGTVSEVLKSIIFSAGVFHLEVGHLIMWLIGLFFVYLAVAKKYEPLLLLPIGFGIFLVNLPLTPLMGSGDGESHRELLNIFYHYGVEWEVIPCVIFLGLGAMTNFAPLIARPSTLLIGAGAQLGVFVTFIGTWMAGFELWESASVSIIGGADGPTTIYLTAKLAPDLMGPNALAAYSYMAMVPLIQPPIIRALTSKTERRIKMKQLRPVSRLEKLFFPIIACALICLLVPSVAPLMGMFMLGNFMRESGVVKRLTDTAQNALMNIVTILLGISVGATMVHSKFLNGPALLIFGLGLIDFMVCTAGGILTVKFMNLFVHQKLNPIIGAAGVSAVPMAARVAQVEGAKADPTNNLLMHGMGPNLAGVIGTAGAAGMFIAMFAG